jgi:putative intracellular protease/amidase
MLLDLVTNWINSEIPPISDQSDAQTIAIRDRRVAKAQAIRQAAIEFEQAYDQRLVDEVAQRQRMTESRDQVVASTNQAIAQKDQLIIQLNERIAQLEAIVTGYEQAKMQQHDWQAIVDQLDAAGFDEHLEAAVAAGVGAFGAASRIIAAVQVGDLATISKYWQTIAQKYPPNAEQVGTWDAILETAKVDDFRFGSSSLNV